MARIGETLDSCRELYGRPLGINTQGPRQTALYKSGRFLVNIVFWREKAFSITYQKLDEDQQPVALTEKQMKRLLEINFGDQEWHPHDKQEGWFTKDLCCAGYVDRETSTYTVMDLLTAHRVGRVVADTTPEENED